jgi:uncharacterized membrane-anchored protein
MSCNLDLNKPGGIKVPLLITIWFWIIKVLCTTVGESAADWLNQDIGIGLGGTTGIMAAGLVLTLIGQFSVQNYIAWLYWLNVMLVSVVGTLVTDLLVDEVGVKLWVCIIIFSVLMLGTFFAWYKSEKTLSIHSINTTKRELFYWLAILFTFALGTAVGDEIAEGLGLGYWQALLVFAAAVASVAALYYLKALGEVLAFWITYILTRPLGASLGDLLSQDGSGGLGLGSGITSAIFLALIVIAVVYLQYSKIDAPTPEDEVQAAKEALAVKTRSTEEEEEEAKNEKKDVEEQIEDRARSAPQE